MCRAFGRLPSEVEREPLLPMVRVVETWHAVDAWSEIRAVSRDPKRSLDELHGRPMVDEMLTVLPEVMSELRRIREQKEAGD